MTPLGTPMGSVANRVLVWTGCLVGMACRHTYRVGDHVLVDWRGADTPAVITAVEGATRFRVHYDGYNSDWDETVSELRLRGAASFDPGSRGAAAQSREAEAASSATPLASGKPQVPSVYRVGEHVRVEWHGATYGATVLEVLGGDRYRVHYDGYGNEWDESIGLYRIVRK